MFKPFRGAIAVCLLASNMLIFASIILIAAAIARILPKKWQQTAMPVVFELPIYWMIVNKWILLMNTRGKWNVEGSAELKKSGWYLIISNHQSWVDIPVLGGVFGDKIPLLKFFMKKELLWQLPIAGLDCYLLGYPILARHSREEIRKRPELKGRDLEAAKKACQQFKIYPTTLMNFVEGTRFTPEKRERQASPYENLLKPKAAGIAVVLTEMADRLTGVINTTLYYESRHGNSLWNFLCGRVDRIYVRYELLQMTPELKGDYYNDRQYRQAFQQWLNCLWKEKDSLINEFKSSSS